MASLGRDSTLTVENQHQRLGERKRERGREIESPFVGNPVTAQRSALTFTTLFIATLRRVIDTSLPQSRATTTLSLSTSLQPTHFS